ncbi:LLM class flavin-dependent oxidoreductase [Neisseria yangbaofengii]|uniref:LLM class flavin-dependent oxidoreductase n=1 Tax=Neisseria yangbaofengii TaxID=2709396 RepID=UPI0013EBE8FE|nr:LLM class flavin-dependent oxidoreductase [Neisseria yangbaofengii]
MLKLSMLNLVPLREGQTQKQAIESMVTLAQTAERLGYGRYWIAEHHNMPNLLSSATQLLVGHTLANTQTIRVGTGGVMLPNHSPLAVAEQYGTLATMYGDRIDLGVGRAPGTDPRTALALRRNAQDVSINFPHDIQTIQRYFGNADEQGYVKAYPAMDKNVPLYILGSSTESAYLAAELGMPYVFASHFAPRMMEMAVQIYRNGFKPSKYLGKPEVIICVNIIVADTDGEAHLLHTSQQQQFLGVVSGQMKPLQPPVADMSTVWTYDQESAVKQMLGEDIVGSKESVHKQLISLQARVQADEIMALNYIYDEAKQAESFEMLKEIADTL